MSTLFKYLLAVSILAVSSLSLARGIEGEHKPSGDRAASHTMGQHKDDMKAKKDKVSDMETKASDMQDKVSDMQDKVYDMETKASDMKTKKDKVSDMKTKKDKVSDMRDATTKGPGSDALGKTADE